MSISKSGVYILAGAAVASVGSLSGPSVARAQQAAAVEEVVVTGSSIRGTPAVGQNIIAVTTNDIREQGGLNISDTLRQVPALSQMGQHAQGSARAANTYFSPNIHQMGGSASGSTLVLFDGLRTTLGGTGGQQTQPDPSIIPTIALQRVDVLAEGASSVYGADAVAGVVNFITRKRFNGVQVEAQTGRGDAYDTYGAQMLMGGTWDTGGALVAFQFADQSNIPNSARFDTADYRSRGGRNLNNFFCTPAAIQPAGSSGIYPSPGATTTIPATTTTDQPCFSNAGDYVPTQLRTNALARFSQEFGTRAEVNATLIYGLRRNISRGGNANLQGTAFGPGATQTTQINPFYANPPGVTATAQTIRTNLSEMLPESKQTDGATSIWTHLEGIYRLGGDWTITANVMGNQDQGFNNLNNGFCNTCALQALNGTSNQAGNPNAIAIPNTTVTSNQLPLTAANALDVWNAPGSNRTSQATLARIGSNQTQASSTNRIFQARLGMTGTLFELPAGPLKVAFGGEMIRHDLYSSITRPSSIGPTAYGTGFLAFNYFRKVNSGYAEAIIPLVSPDMNMTLVRKLDVALSARYDHYSILGATTNPKISAEWLVVDGFKFRGTYSTSFVAPPQTSIGDPDQGYLSAFSSVGGAGGLLTFNTAQYPGTAGVLPGCAANAVTCNLGTAAVQGFATLSGLGANALPYLGEGWTLGVDFAPTSFLRGFRGSFTLFHNELRRVVQTMPADSYTSIPELNQYVTICPTGCSPALIAEKTAGYSFFSAPLPNPAYYYVNNNQKNVLNIKALGMDFATSYDFPTDIGDFSIGVNGSYFFKYEFGYHNAFNGTDTEYFDVLNTNGQSSTFPQLQLQARGWLGWSNQTISARLFANYSGSYTNWGGGTLIPIVRDPVTRIPLGGGDPVDSNLTFDLNLAYNLPDGFIGGQHQLFLNARNLFDTDPPFANTGTGNDENVSNWMGRIVSVGIRMAW